MDELFTLLKKYCDDFYIYSETIDKTSIEFESFDELMEYTNFEKGRIKNLRICGYTKNFIYEVITLTIYSEYAFSPTVKCIYKFGQQEEENNFTIKLKEIFDKSKSFHVPVMIQTVVLSTITWVFLIGALKSVLSHTGYELPYTINILTEVLAFAVVFTINIFFLSIIIRLSPPVCFSWGEAVKYYIQLNKWRSNLFWCVFVAIVIAIIANFIYNQLFIS